jgi:hypothetical protein
MVEIPKKKGASVERKRLIADIPEPVYRALKIRSAETDLEMREIVTEALRRYLGVKEGGEKHKK